ncbi:hypothetical protein TNCV_3103441 [Trichonephila clavipes]|nr:hypothetical protein TNCV_3103441 [Trichonephila clavipes]
MSFDNALWKAVFTGSSNTNTAPCTQSTVQQSRRIDEVDISTPVEQTNLLPTTWRKLYGHSPPFGAGDDGRALTSPSVVHCQFFELFGVRRSTAS